MSLDFGYFGFLLEISDHVTSNCSNTDFWSRLDRMMDLRVQTIYYITKNSLIIEKLNSKR